MSACTDRVSPPRTAVRTDSPTTSVVATRASPIIRADAVDAVRRGLRTALRAATRDGTPDPRNGAPIAATTGPDRKRATPATPRNTSSAPSATPCTLGSTGSGGRPSARPATMRPATRSREPNTGRPRPRRDGVASIAEIAAIGGTDVARRIGPMTETTVTPTPTTTARTTVRGSTTTSSSGSCTPHATTRRCIPIPSPMPARTPRSDAAAPTSTPSTSTDAATW